MSGSDKLTNNELVRRLAKEQRNEELWEEFCRRFKRSIMLAVIRECKHNGLTKEHLQCSDIVHDLVQDVFYKLLDKECYALQKFIGARENSIFTYLGIIARNVVSDYLNKLKAKKWIKLQTSLDKPLHTKESHKVKLGESIQSPELDAESELIFKDEVEKFLDDYLQGKDSERDKLIFRLYFYEQYTAQEIFEYFNFNISLKSIRNLISKIHHEMRKNKLL